MKYVVDPGKRLWVPGLMTPWGWLCDPNPNTGYSSPPTSFHSSHLRLLRRNRRPWLRRLVALVEVAFPQFFWGLPPQDNFLFTGMGNQHTTSHKRELQLMCFLCVGLKHVYKQGWLHAYLLFEVPSVLLIHQHQVEEVADWELLVHISHSGGQVVTGQEEADGNGLS